MVAVGSKRGPQGPEGPEGPAGPAGQDGVGDLTYLHLQLVPSATWVIDHGLGKEPAVVTIDSADAEVLGDVSYPTLDRVVVTFSAATGGRARLN